MVTAIKVKCLPEPELQFSNGRRDLDPRRALAANGPADHRGLRTIRVGLVGLADEVSAARAWIASMAVFRPARERFRSCAGSRDDPARGISEASATGAIGDGRDGSDTDDGRFDELRPMRELRRRSDRDDHHRHS